MPEPKTTGILEKAPLELDRPLTADETKELESYPDQFDWSNEKPPEVKKDKEPESQPKAKTAEEETAEAAKQEQAESDRLTAKAESLGKTVEEIKTGEAEELKQENERIEKLAKEQNKPVDEVRKAEEDRKKAEVGKTDAQKEQERLESIAKEEGITVDEVKDAEEKDKAAAEKYGKDPLKIAKALRKENSAYGKLKADHEKLEKFKKEIDLQRIRYDEEKINTDLEAQRDKIVDEYIKLNPKEADEQEAVIFERAKVKIKSVFQAREEATNKQIQADAETRRGSLLEKVPEEYKEFKSEIREILKSEDDDVVLNDEFDVTNLCFWARGKKYTAEYVKSLEDAAYKRGKEQSVIVKNKVAPINSNDRQPDKTKVVTMASESDKQRAFEIFVNKDDWSEEKKIQEYMTNHKAHDNW